MGGREEGKSDGKVDVWMGWLCYCKYMNAELGLGGLVGLELSLLVLFFRPSRLQVRHKGLNKDIVM